jgi:hypothetical protein
MPSDSGVESAGVRALAEPGAHDITSTYLFGSVAE